MFDSTALYDQNTFYKSFERDLLSAQQEVIIESPFITEKRMNVLLPIFIKMRRRNITVVVNTRNPKEHDGDYYYQALDAVAAMQDMGITVLYTVGLHRKLAIIDRRIAYEGSLNILSFSDSCEIMKAIGNFVLVLGSQFGCKDTIQRVFFGAPHSCLDVA